MRRLAIGVAVLLIAACTSAPPTLRVEPTAAPVSRGGGASENTAAPQPPTPIETATRPPATATPAPTLTPPADAVACPFTGWPTLPATWEEKRRVLVRETPCPGRRAGVWTGYPEDR